MIKWKWHTRFEKAFFYLSLSIVSSISIVVFLFLGVSELLGNIIELIQESI